MSEAGSSRRQLALGLLSAALLAFQIALLQILATSQWHHFAAFVISCALLGFGAAGTTLSLLRTWMCQRQLTLLPLLSVLSAVTLAGSVTLPGPLFGGFDSMLLFVNPGEALRLAAVALLLMLPFYFGALFIGLIFTLDTEQIGHRYFANMLGSGFGSLLGLVGLAWLLPQALVPLCALLILAAGALLLPGARRAIQLCLPGGLLLVAGLALLPSGLHLSQYKDLSRILDLPGARIIAHQPSATGQIHLVNAPELRSASGLSLNWHGVIPSRPAAFVNGNLVGNLPPKPGTDLLNASTYALPYALLEPQSLLVLQAGTGVAVARAVDNHASSVTVVEPNRALLEILASKDQHFAQLHRNDRIAWQTVTPRTWLARDRQQYDLIIFPDVGSFGGTAGLFALDEQPLMTRESLQLAWQRLSPTGLLSVTSWVDYPVRNPVRLLATLLETLDTAGVDDPAAHLVAVRSWGTITFCVKRTPLTPEEIAAVRAFATRWSFDPALLPGLSPDERQAYNRLHDDTLLTLFDALLDTNRESIYRDYPFRLRPVNDDRPFFSQFLRWSRLSQFADLYGQQSLPFMELGLLVAGMAALVLTMMAILLIVLPLVRLPRQERQGRRCLLYFGGLGLGYMWVEMALLHRFVIYLGQPAFAVALVVGTMLAGSAFGSILTDRLEKIETRRWTALVAGGLGLYVLFLPSLLQQTLAQALTFRALLAILVVTPAAVIMGMPFPLGLKHLHRTSPSEVPWAWGINGCLSVVGAALATLIVVEVGYSLLLLLASIAYLVAATVTFHGTRSKGDPFRRLARSGAHQ